MMEAWPSASWFSTFDTWSTKKDMVQSVKPKKKFGNKAFVVLLLFSEICSQCKIDDPIRRRVVGAVVEVVVVLMMLALQTRHDLS